MSKSIEDDTIRGAWHYLCVGVLTQAVARAAESANLWTQRRCSKINGGVDKELVYQREAARRWLEGGVGLVTYEDCCEAMGVDPVRAREKIMAYCHARRRVKPKEEVRDDGEEEAWASQEEG